MSEILVRSLLTLAFGCLLALPLIRVREIGRGFFTFWVATVGALGGIGLLLRASGFVRSATPGGAAARDRTSLLLAVALALLAAFWIVLRISAYQIATLTLLASVVAAGLALRELALAPMSDGGPRPMSDQSTRPVSDPSPRPMPDPSSRSMSDPGRRPMSDPGRRPMSDPGPRPMSDPAARPTVSGSARAVSPTGETAGETSSPAADGGGPGLRTISLLLSAFVVGLVTVAMVLGHWYLVQPKLAVAPLRRMCDVFLVVLLVRLGVTAWGFASSLAAGRRFFGGPEPIPWEILILTQRFLFGFGGAIILAIMIKKTVALRSTMAATGLLYIAILFVWVGEFLSIYLARLSGGALVV